MNSFCLERTGNFHIFTEEQVIPYRKFRI